MRIAEIEGKVFRGPTGEEYGVIRAFSGLPPEDLEGDILAEDGSGNFFLLLRSGVVAFWDHETSEVTWLAESLASFASTLVAPEPVVLREEQAKSVWVDPEFAKELGLPGNSE